MRVAVRPERVEIRPDGLATVVSDAVFFGSSLKVMLRLASGETLILRSSAPNVAQDVKTGAPLTVGWDAGAQQVIDLK